MAKDNEKDIFKTLQEVGCCNRCILRYLNDDKTDFKTTNCFSEKFKVPEIEDNQQEVKRMKLNPCVVCLDLLEDHSLQESLLNPILDNISEYDSETFVNYLSFPISVLIREHSLHVYLTNKYPDYFKDSFIYPLNKVWTLSLQNRLAIRLNKKYDKNSGLLINFHMEYELEDEESLFITKIKSVKGVLSRNVVTEILESVSDEVFQQHIKVPPEIPSKSLCLKTITFHHEPIYIAGRYCKYSRNLGQTPWIVDGVRIIENSVQEIIFRPLEDTFNFKNLVFSASGREDADVRMLGRGRPFFIKIPDSKKTHFTHDQFRSIEEEIHKSREVQVRDLQLISKNDVNNIKDGEQFKKKIYRALCIVQEPEKRDEIVKKINEQTSIKIYQKTPIRVFHRRSSAVREREIYKIEAKPVIDRNNLLEIDVITQAGTYVKEFIHGDLGRTKPSVCDIIGGDIDILALDVLDVLLDFPPKIEYTI